MRGSVRGSARGGVRGSVRGGVQAAERACTTRTTRTTRTTLYSRGLPLRKVAKFQSAKRSHSQDLLRLQREPPRTARS